MSAPPSSPQPPAGLGMADGSGTEPEDLQGLTMSVGQLELHTTSMLTTGQGQRYKQEAGPAETPELLVSDDGYDDFWCEDEPQNDISDDGLSQVSMLDREWKWRHGQFHTMGYREGITAGKEASAQEGFNVGFKESVHVGYKWGLVRGVTSALASLSDHFKEKLVRESKSRDRFQKLYRAVHTISGNDALMMYYNNTQQNGSVQSHDPLVEDSQIVSEMDEDPGSNKLESLYRDLIFLLHESPDIKMNVELESDTFAGPSY